MDTRSFLRAARRVLLVLALAPAASAGGLYVAEFATVDMSAAGAGSLVRANDASTALLNPAGMTYLDSHQLNMGLAPGASIVKYDHDASATGPATGFGGNGGNQGGLIPLLSTGYVHKISDRFRAGLAVFSISGAALDPANDWIGNNQVQEIQLFTLTIVPTVAVRVTDWLSVGAGPAITYGNLNWKLNTPAGQFDLDDMDDWQVAAQVGVLLQPIEPLRIGFVYQSETKFKLKGDIDGPAGQSPSGRVKLPLAHAYRLDVGWQLTEDLAFSFGGAFEDWSTLDTTSFQVGNAPDSTIPLGFKDTYKIRGGVHYQVNEKWFAQTGVSYDSSALDNSDRTAALPIDEQWRWGIGGVYRYSEGTKIGFGFQYLNLGKGKINNPQIKGEYEQNHIFFFMINVNFEKLPWDGMASF